MMRMRVYIKARFGPRSLLGWTQESWRRRMIQTASSASSDVQEQPPRPVEGCLAEQLDEVQLLEAMVGREGEFEWGKQGPEGRVSGRLQVFLSLESELELCVAKRERVSTASKVPALPSKNSKVAHLPPISLHFQLPPDYPETSKPIFTLTCSWLNFSQLSTLCHKLDSLWDKGCVVLFTWQQFLSSDLLTTLNISSKLVLRFEDPLALGSKRDERAVQDMLRPSLLIPFLLDYDRRERERAFSETFFDCEICFTTVPGSKCCLLEPCRHTHCRECLSLYVTTKITSGGVLKIGCPSISCEESLSLSLIQKLVSPELFERFDRILLQKTIDKMSDVAYCPRPSCRCVTLKEEDEVNMALCPRCCFSFCVLCKRSWHGVEPCKLLPTNLKDLRKAWNTLGSDERKEMELQFGKSKLEKAFQEYDSMQWLDSNSRKCPNCQAKIEKALGCNKMTCTYCNSNFCWLCCAALLSVNPYKHFQPGQSECAGKLFQGLTDSDEEDFWM